ncbi:MAG TPA: response regulator transcription factor [Ktedonobacteraceae bacterium]
MSKGKVRILVIEDEKELARALRRGLVTQGYEVLLASTGEEALTMVEEHRPALLLLDLGLPKMSGLEVCKRVRAQSDVLPILVLSVRNKEQEKVRALDLGADDYIAKPFGMEEVLARIRVALRHAGHLRSGTEQLTLGPLQIDFAQHFVSMNGQEVILTPTEYHLLTFFLEHRGKILTQQMLLSHIWSTSQKKQEYLHVYVGRLRRKIEPDPTHPRFIQTISGVGYRFQDE